MPSHGGLGMAFKLSTTMPKISVGQSFSAARAWFKVFQLLDRIRLHVLPKHYYTPVPDYSWLRRNQAAWIGRAPLHGVVWDLDRQLAWLRDISTPYYREVAGLEFYNELTTGRVGPGFGAIESQVLHCFIRAMRPARIVEIGGGVSTFCMARAAEMNARDNQKKPTITCIEPFPTRALAGVEDISHIRQLCQIVPSSVFEQLEAGDLLSIDSTHAVKVGSEVLCIYLDIVPALRPGVFIHIHDIFLPYLYPRGVLVYPFAWQETALVLALLTDNRRLQVLASLSALHYDRPAELQCLFSDYRPQDNREGLCPHYPPKGDFPNSLWLQTC